MYNSGHCSAQYIPIIYNKNMMSPNILS